MRANPYYHFLVYPERLSRRKQNTLTGFVVGDGSCMFMFPDLSARTYLTHVIAVSL
jgi:hypothetical protein